MLIAVKNNYRLRLYALWEYSSSKSIKICNILFVGSKRQKEMRSWSKIEGLWVGSGRLPLWTVCRVKRERNSREAPPRTLKRETAVH